MDKFTMTFYRTGHIQFHDMDVPYNMGADYYNDKKALMAKVYNLPLTDIYFTIT